MTDRRDQPRRGTEQVRSDMNVAGNRMNDAIGTARAAAQIVETSHTAAVSLSHDATRKAITAHMAAQGLRPKKGEGAHRVVTDYAANGLSHLLSAADIEAIDELRRARGRAE